MTLDEKTFDDLADRELTALVRALDLEDGLEVELTLGVLKIAFEAGGPEFVVNSHRAAGQIWMAADRNAWHFDPASTGEAWTASRPPHDDLRAVLAGALSARLGRPVRLPR